MGKHIIVLVSIELSTQELIYPVMCEGYAFSVIIYYRGDICSLVSVQSLLEPLISFQDL